MTQAHIWCSFDRIIVGLYMYTFLYTPCMETNNHAINACSLYNPIVMMLAMSIQSIKEAKYTVSELML